MLSRTCAHSRILRRWVSSLLVGLLVASHVSVATAGHGFFRNNAVGGISISADGVVGQPVDESRSMLLKEMRQEFKPLPSDLNAPTELRKISLKRLEAAIEHARRNNLGRLPDEIQYLAGLQRIQYVFVYPEQNDIVIAGPAEGWKIADDASVVGITTGRPVLQLDDLLVAFRQVHAARTEGISVSIDPTEEGMTRLQTLLDREQQNRGPRNFRALEAAMKDAFGPQQVKLSGVPADSHFARVLVAADYKMKRLAMNLDEAPVKGLPSYVDMIQGKRVSAKTNPRWWLACHYEPLAKSDDGLAWELNGPGVKALTEDEFISDSGEVQGSGKSSSAAQRWADLLTEKYAELASRDPVFGELRNLMDMCVIAALIEKEGLMEKAGCSLPLITNGQSDLAVQEWNAPKSVPPQCSFLKTAGGYIVTASGGVQIESWQVASNVTANSAVSDTRAKAAAGNADVWWWN